MITNLSNAYIGDASISRIYQGDELVYVTGHPDICCEWISNGDASTNPDVYFNTSIAPDLTLKVETKYSYHNRNYSGGAALFGSRASATDSRYYLFTFAGLQIDGQSLYTAKFWFKNQEGYSAVVPTLDEPHVITTCATYSSASAATAVNCILDGSTTSRAVTINQALSNTHQMYMFAINNQGTVDYRCLADTRIYYMKIWRDNRLARFYVPVLHWRNGQYVPCFYDKVTDIYIYNLGTDTPTYKIQGDYLLDYIANGPDSDSNSTKDMYFDSSVLANANTRCEMKTAIPAFKTQWFCGGCTNGFIGFEMGVSAYHRPYTRIGSYLENGQNTYSNDIQLNVPYTTVLYHDGTNQKTLFNTEVATTTSGDVNANRFSSTQGIILFARGLDGTIYTAASYSGMKIYYTNFASGNIPSKSYIPVFHNNQAAFLDLNSGTYIYNIGTDAPYYQFKS